jgi:hypothetical protein
LIRTLRLFSIGYEYEIFASADAKIKKLIAIAKSKHDFLVLAVGIDIAKNELLIGDERNAVMPSGYRIVSKFELEILNSKGVNLGICRNYIGHMIKSCTLAYGNNMLFMVDSNYRTKRFIIQHQI